MSHDENNLRHYSDNRHQQKNKFEDVSYTSATQLPYEEDCSSESVEDLRRRLNSMKQLMNERNNSAAHILNGDSQSSRNGSVIDDKFLSVIFMFVLCIIITVSSYAFYNLYTAIVKKFTPRHDEL
ncbi:uncharacterized protein LOC123293827 [Chrysoperla carnea]|uniref:uncharacterized protein LOC123293827 n=1 Tax=Chrysoperla carnea TaxID=189513 RepID=UPI001D07C325|nr:uncharacterized protein LOC123293827 [Chrysoperla carnea]